VKSFYKTGDMVVIRQGREAGRVGMVFDLHPPMADVAFGADGPRRRYYYGSLRRATEVEVKEAGLAGVEHNIYE